MIQFPAFAIMKMEKGLILMVKALRIAAHIHVLYVELNCHHLQDGTLVLVLMEKARQENVDS